MTIGIDASRAIKSNRTGTENYCRNLILAILKIAGDQRIRLYFADEPTSVFKNLPKNFETKVIKRKKYWTQIGLSLEILKNPPDVLFVPAHILPPITAKKSVVTIHDLAWKYFPEAYSASERRLQDLAIRRAIKKHADIIVYSESTASDLKKFYKFDDKKIHFVPMGFEPRHCEEERRSNLPTNKDCRASLAMTNQKYILFVGRLEAKKNILNLIESYKLLRQERKISEKLVLVGKPGFRYDEIKKMIDSAGKIKNDIIETGFVSDDELSKLYKNASVFVFPSLYEGFGFPILEAFAAGTPVVTSNTSSMPEVAGDAAILVNPKKPFEIAAAISQILNKPRLRDDLVKKGFAQLKNYDWNICAKETLKILTGTDDKFS
ncbi:MAG: glycosyltransferase family 1 protein [Candidatus Berkelbacteria bacterium]|nr:glycosyltransferase family 1 protein [Candidatus Berkelbacteria bacterium]